MVHDGGETLPVEGLDEPKYERPVLRAIDNEDTEFTDSARHHVPPPMNRTIAYNMRAITARSGGGGKHAATREVAMVLRAVRRGWRRLRVPRSSPSSACP